MERSSDPEVVTVDNFSEESGHEEKWMVESNRHCI